MKIDNLLPTIKDICEKRGIVYMSAKEDVDKIPCYILMSGRWIMIRHISEKVSESILEELDYLKPEIEEYYGYSLLYGEGRGSKESNDILLRLVPKKADKYSTMSKSELQEEIDKALDDENYEEIGKISGYMKEGMRYLKSYKVFENNSSVIEDLKDICIELEHEGFEIEVSSREIRIEKLSPVEYPELDYAPLDYTWKNVEEVVDRLREYLGGKLNEMTIYTDHEDFTWDPKDISGPPTGIHSLDIYLIIIEFNL